MSIHSIRLQHIRAHTDSSYEFSGGVNVLIGPNACGKTTVLEAISLLSLGKLPSSAAIKDILASSSDWHRADMVTSSDERTFKYQNDTKEFVFDENVKKRIGAADVLPIVWFDPEELRLLRGSPARRREYFDNLLSQLKPRYKDSLNRYKRALLQRNTLLKKGNVNPDDVFVWNLRLTENAEIVHAARLELLGEINTRIPELYKHLSGQEKLVQLTYQSNLGLNNYSEKLLASLQQNVYKDSMLGFTSVGIHRDDFVFTEDEQKISSSASRGEIRTLMLALKLIEMEKLTQATGKKPVLLFDDVFSELDGSRRKAFTGSLKDHQTIITTTDADIVTKDFAERANIIAVA